jgi:hypothetical protein
MNRLLWRHALLAAVFFVSFSNPFVQPAFAVENHCGPINADQTWLGSGTVHRVTCNVTVNSGYTLTIEAGAIVKFDLGTSLFVLGALRVLGSADSPTHFTSIRDDTIGGDTNGDGNATQPARGDWFRIEFGANSDSATSLIDHAVIRYGGRTTGYPYVYYGAITLLSASPTVQNTTIGDSLNYAYRADLNSFPTLTNNTLINKQVYQVEAGNT